MGTPNLSICKKDGAFKIVQYGQWDGYPSGQGITILTFCRDGKKLNTLKQIVNNILDIEELPEFIEEYNSLLSCVPDKRTAPMRYWYKTLNSRDIGGKIFNNIITLDKARLPQIMNNNIYISKYEDFDEGKIVKDDDIWIKYAYMIDFDENKLKCYSGNSLIGIYDLDNLPTDETFISELEKAKE